MTDPDELALDILTGMLGDVAHVVGGGDAAGLSVGISDQIIEALDHDDARSVLAAMSGIACVLLESARQNTGHSAEDILATMRRALA